MSAAPGVGTVAVAIIKIHTQEQIGIDIDDINITGTFDVAKGTGYPH